MGYQEVRILSENRKIDKYNILNKNINISGQYINLLNSRSLKVFK